MSSGSRNSRWPSATDPSESPGRDSEGEPTRDLEDDLPSASLARLRTRALLLGRLRRFFDERGFLEVDTPLLSADTVVDLHLDPLPVTLFGDPRQPERGRRLWLQTSPEFAMKRLLAAGATAIYQVTHAFRAGEVGAFHNPEFTLAEWYRVGDTMSEAIELLGTLCGELLGRPAAEPLSYRAAFELHLALNPHSASTSELAAAALRHGLTVTEGFAEEDRDEWLNLLLAHCIEPRLGRDRPTILYHYPASQAALAQVQSGPEPVAERFELYVDGMELANGYQELLDAQELRRRSERANDHRTAAGKYPLPVESRLLRAMDRGLPPCTGVALGFDRLVLLACGATTLAEVLPFPIDRA